MNTSTIINKLSLKEKLLNLFIVGFDSARELENLKTISNQGLGGVIFFAKNFTTRQSFVNLVNNIQENKEIPLFLSIDQEGGLVERTITLNEKIKYLTPLSCSKLSKVDFKKHYAIMSKDLASLGFNLNFAPCTDVNTQELNPIIGVRSYANEVKKVKELSEFCSQIYKKNGIIPVLKHFPGHGSSKIDSHLDMPTIDLDLEELEKRHIEAFRQQADMVMVAHAYYPCFDKEKTPASLSKNVISYLRNNVGFDGVIISDDMVMGGISKYYNPVDACIKALNAGVDMLIFRNSDDNLIQTIEELYQRIKKDEVSKERLNAAFTRVIELKNTYNLIAPKPIVDIKSSQKEINKLALSVILKQGNTKLEPGKTLIISPNKQEIFNLSFDNSNLSEFIDADEVFYDLGFNNNFINLIEENQKNYTNIIFVGYNTLLSNNQQNLIAKLNNYIAVSIGIDENIKCFKNAKGTILANGYNEPVIKAISLKLQAI